LARSSGDKRHLGEKNSFPPTPTTATVGRMHLQQLRDCVWQMKALPEKNIEQGLAQLAQLQFTPMNCFAFGI